MMRPHFLSLVVTAMLLQAPNAYAGSYAPLKCKNAGSPSQHKICEIYDLGQKEARMATLYAVATSLVAMGQRGDIQDAQRTWLKNREACGGDAACLNKVYDARIEALNGIIAGVALRGPF